MPGIFCDTSHESALRENGYLVLPFLSSVAVEELRAIYQAEKVINNTACFAINTVNDEDSNNRISDGILNIFKPFLDKIFTQYAFIGATFLIKEKANGELGLHQDCTVVDEKQHEGYFIWVPLQGVTKRNGGLFLIEKSHLLFNNYCSYSYKNRDIGRKTLPAKFIKPINLNAGEMIIFSTRLFHGSYINNSKRERIAINALITDQDAPLIYYYHKDDLTASVYSMSKSAYINSYREYSSGQLPRNALYLHDIPYQHIPIDEKSLFLAISGKTYKKRTQLMALLSHLLPAPLARQVS